MRVLRNWSNLLRLVIYEFGKYGANQRLDMSNTTVDSCQYVTMDRTANVPKVVKND